MGATLVWSPDTGSYEVDPSRTGAPATGVRFIYYAIDPATKTPALPLNELGRIDLTDRSSGGSGLTLGVQVVNTAGSSDVTLADYTIEGSFVLSGDTRLQASAEGYVSDGTDRLDFDLTQEVELPAGSSTVSGTTHYVLSSGDVTVTLDTDGSFDLDTGRATAASLTLTVAKGPDSAAMHVTVAADGGLDGSITHGGSTVILIGGTTDQPTFTKPDGSAPSDQKVAALKDLFGAADGVAGFAVSVLGVFGGGA